MTHLRVWFSRDESEGFFGATTTTQYTGIVVGSYGTSYGHVVVRLDSGEMMTLNDWDDIEKSQWVEVKEERNPLPTK